MCGKRVNEDAINDSAVVATRLLEYSRKGEQARQLLAINIYSPVLRKHTHDGIRTNHEPYSSTVRFGSLVPEYMSYGSDSLQALTLAIDIDPVIAGLIRHYDFFKPGSNDRYLDSIFDYECLNKNNVMTRSTS